MKKKANWGLITNIKEQHFKGLFPVLQKDFGFVFISFKLNNYLLFYFQFFTQQNLTLYLHYRFPNRFSEIIFLVQRVNYFCIKLNCLSFILSQTQQISPANFLPNKKFSQCFQYPSVELCLKRIEGATPRGLITLRYSNITNKVSIEWRNIMRKTKGIS